MRKPVIVAAACFIDNIIFVGARHYDDAMRSQIKAVKNLDKSNTIQGFIDQFGTFYDRKQAMIAAKESGQFIDYERNGFNDTILYSEGLY